MMSGAHADIEAVFDYAPDAKLLAAAAKADEDDWNDDDAGHSGMTDRSHSIRSRVDSDIEEESSDDDHDSDHDDGSAVRPLPIIARETVTSPPDGILSISPQRTRTLGTQITFDSRSPDRRRSLPATTGDVPAPRGRAGDGQSVLQRLYGNGNNTLDSTGPGTRGGGWDANPPSWVLELNATLRGIEERQKHLEQILGGARGSGAASIASDTEI
jgi:hypothetical protein